MRMKQLEIMAAVLAVALTMFAASVQAENYRTGEVIMLEPIENRGSDESEVTQGKRKVGRALGGLAGMGILGLGKGGSAGTIVAGSAGDIGEKIATNVGYQGPTTRYMVKVRIDGGKIMAITQMRQQLGGIQVGSRVQIEGTGNSVLIYPEN